VTQLTSLTSQALTPQALAVGRWTRTERMRLSAILGVVALLHLMGIALYLHARGNVTAAGGLAGAGTLAYALGMRHAFDADHIAAIDDTTRLMLLRGRRPVGVGFFFAMGHSTVVLALALLVAYAATSVSDGLRASMGTVAVLVAMTFLLLVAYLNAVVLRNIIGLWRGLRAGRMDDVALERTLLDRGLLNRLLGGRARGLIRSSWHMYPVGVLMGLGLETASEITLLSLSASTAVAGRLPLYAVLSLPLLFAAGMSAFDTADSLLMTRAYSWAYRNPARTLFYNIATTTVTVAVAAFIASVYLADVLVTYAGLGFLSGYAGLADHFELFGYGIAGIFVVTWGGALLWWRLRGYDARYGGAR
jgi:high-affinity nickel-transport protein